MNTSARILAEIERLSQGGRDTEYLRVKDIKYFKDSSEEEIQDLLRSCISLREYESIECLDTCIRLCREYLGWDIATNQSIRNNLISIIQKLDSEANSLRVRLNIPTDSSVLNNISEISFENLLDIISKFSSEISSLCEQLRHRQSSATTSSVGEMSDKLNNSEEDFLNVEVESMSNPSDEGMREFMKESNELRDKEGIKPLSDEKPLLSTGKVSEDDKTSNPSSIYNELISGERLLASKGRTGSKHVNLVSDEGMKESNELISGERLLASKGRTGNKHVNLISKDENPLISTGEMIELLNNPGEDFHNEKGNYLNQITNPKFSNVVNNLVDKVSDFRSSTTTSIESNVELLNNPEEDFHNTKKGIKSNVDTLPKMSTEQMAEKVGISIDEMQSIKDKYLSLNSTKVPEQEDYKCPKCGSTNVTKTFDRVLRIPVLTCNDCVRELQSNPNYKEDMNGDILSRVDIRDTEKGLNSFSGLQDKSTTTMYGKSDAELTKQLYIRNAIRERLEAFAGEVYFDIFDYDNLSMSNQICTVNEESLVKMMIECITKRDIAYDIIKQFVSRFPKREIYSLVDSVLNTLYLIDSKVLLVNRIKSEGEMEDLIETPNISPDLRNYYESVKFSTVTTPKTMSMREEQAKDTGLEDFLNKIYLKVVEEIDKDYTILREVLKVDLTQSYKLPKFDTERDILSESKELVAERLREFVEYTASRKIGTLPVNISKVKDLVKIATRKKTNLQLPITSYLAGVNNDTVLIRDNKAIKVTGLLPEVLFQLEANSNGLIAVTDNKLYDKVRVWLDKQHYSPRAVNITEYLSKLGFDGTINVLECTVNGTRISDLVDTKVGQDKLYLDF